jgi:precorrin-3B C17-methyltransferase
MRTSCASGCAGIGSDFAENEAKRCNGSPGRGRLAVVGTGPGELAQLSQRAVKALSEADVIAGYKTYLELIQDIIAGKEIISTGMTREIERCEEAIRRARAGAQVALVSSGDPGVYGMAGLVLELLERDGALEEIDVDIVPGITSATSSAAILGAPLMHDFTVISLSDLLTPWEVILMRLEMASRGDFVVVLYNPASKKRTEQVRTAREIMLGHKSPATPVGIVRNAARDKQETVITDLERMLEHPIDMFTTIIVGNSRTRRIGKYMVTPRGYQV